MLERNVESLSSFNDTIRFSYDITSYSGKNIRQEYIMQICSNTRLTIRNIVKLSLRFLIFAINIRNFANGVLQYENNM